MAHTQIQAVPANKFFFLCSEGTYVLFWIQLSKWNLIWVRVGRWRRAGRFLLLLKAVAPWPLSQHVSDLPQREELALYLCKPQQSNFR